MRQDSNLFIAISTGQNIGNLLPILDLLKTGDQVLWIESATAKKKGWSTGALAVLRKRIAPAKITCLDVEDDPASLQRLLAKHIHSHSQGLKLKLVGNGGTKPQMLAAFRALNGHLDELVYNSDQQCVLEHYQYTSAQMEPATRTLYQSDGMDLADVLICKGMEMMPDPNTQQIWPGKTLPLPRYGNDVAYIKECHDQIWERGQNRHSIPNKAIPYEDALQLAPQQAKILRDVIIQRCKLHSLTQINAEGIKHIYASAHRLSHEACQQQANKVYPAPTCNIGSEFEKVVAARVSIWLETAPSHITRIIQSVWRNVKIRRQGDTPIVAEFDIAIVLKSGMLLHLECKSFDADLKDMDARLVVLQRSTSNLSKIAICVPNYGFDTTGWHQKLLANVDKIREWTQFKLIEVGLPGQTEPSFENSLQGWLGQFAIR